MEEDTLEAMYRRDDEIRALRRQLALIKAGKTRASRRTNTTQTKLENYK